MAQMSSSLGKQKALVGNDFCGLNKRDMDVWESRLLMACTVKLANLRVFKNAGDEEKTSIQAMEEANSYKFPQLNLTRDELVELFGKSRYYGEVKEAANGMIKSYFEREEEVERKGKKVKKGHVYTVFTHICGDEVDGVTFEFNRDMCQWLIDFSQNGYVQVLLTAFNTFSNVRAQWFYVFVLQWAKIGEKYVTTHEFRNIIGVDQDAYKGRYDRFKQRVFEPVIEAINTSVVTRYTVDYEEVRGGRGRKVQGYNFKFTKKEPVKALEDVKKIPAPVEEEAPPKKARKSRKTKQNVSKIDMSEFSEPERDALRRMIEVYNLDPELAAYFMRENHLQYCQENMEYVRKVKKAGNARNLGGYLRTALERNYAGQYHAQEEAKAREKQAEAENRKRDREAWELFHGNPAAAEAEQAPKQQEDTSKDKKPHEHNEWDDIIETAKDCIGALACNSWLHQLNFVSSDDTTVNLTGSQFTKDWVSDKYLDQLEEKCTNGKKINIAVV